MPQDAVALIKADHRKVEQLFREFEEAGDRAFKTKQQLVEQIIKELEVHATIEEETYYPAVEAKARKDGKEMVAEASRSTTWSRSCSASWPRCRPRTRPSTPR